MNGIQGVSLGDKSFLVHREVEQQGCITPHTLIVKLRQIISSFHLVILALVIEPSWTDRHVTFGSYPSITVGMSHIQFIHVRIARIHVRTTQERPVGSTSYATLIAHPAAARASIREANGIRLQLLHHRPCLGEIVVVATVYVSALAGPTIVAITTIGTIEPNLEEIAIAREKVLQLSVIILHV